MKMNDNVFQVKFIFLWELKLKDMIEFCLLDENVFYFFQCKLDVGEGKDRVYNLEKIENELVYKLILDKLFINILLMFFKILFVDELF